MKREEAARLIHNKVIYSRTNIDRAGRLLLDKSATPEQVESALDLLVNWRSAHAFPLNTMTMDLRQKVNRVDSKALVVQRLKRTRSILAKLAKESSMRLTQMQDIGGCRAVVTSIDEVYALRQLYKKSRSQHEFVEEDDYIASPKLSGYRSLHLVYRFKSRGRPEYDKLLFEIQLRTRIQHAWATAVETVGVVIGQALKSSEGEQAWLTFFQHAASALAISEKASVIPGLPSSRGALARALAKMSADLQVRKKLDAYRTALKHTEKLDARKAGYYLLVLLPDTPELQIFSFSKRNAAGAYREYEKFERHIPQAHQGRQLSLFPELSDYTGAQAVLVGADSLRSIRESYPNYYLDTKVFLDEITSFIRRYKRSAA
jgi:ppGpp synthetase/RelA/SpoT-type nucleotidyltranferase